MSTNLHELATSVIQSCLPQSLLTEDDRAAIQRNEAFLLGMEDELVSVFYDSLFAHEPTAAVFEDGERPERENTLRHWWQRTVQGPLDDSYFSWMALVGIIHIRRGVQNPMMLSMFHLITDAIHAKALKELGEAEAEALRVALSHLSSTASSVISDSYTRTYTKALYDLAGLNPGLTERMLHIEVKEIESKGRAELG